MDRSHTHTQMAPISRVSCWPKRSSLRARGVSCCSAAASCTPCWIRPISVRIPVLSTTATAAPEDTIVEAKSIPGCPAGGALASADGSVVLSTVTDSPVREASSTRMVVVRSSTMRQSAGTLSPVRHSITSPGTSSEAGRSSTHSPFRRHRAHTGVRRLRASTAPWADCCCQTPTTALSTRMERITAGSTHPWSSRSITASAPEMAAVARSTFTRESSNWSTSIFHRGVPLDSTSLLGPCSA
mmetsp:Transcript_5514/g.18652  ORF Transcript_5514/g.18652 Transcript_5514/m.18652 type:complete len:242 (+) Transcript_5514:2814-3539(+)